MFSSGSGPVTVHALCPPVPQVTGFFKGMSFPLASITLYNSLVFGFFSNAQRLISKYRHGDGHHGDGRQARDMLDLTVASMLTGLVSVGLGAPVDLVKIRLQMQTQTVVAGNWNKQNQGVRNRTTGAGHGQPGTNRLIDRSLISDSGSADIDLRLKTNSAEKQLQFRRPIKRST